MPVAFQEFNQLRVRVEACENRLLVLEQLAARISPSNEEVDEVSDAVLTTPGEMMHDGGPWFRVKLRDGSVERVKGRTAAAKLAQEHSGVEEPAGA